MSNISQSDVIAVIENALELESGRLTGSTCAEEIDTWDSLGQLNILVALDKLFEGKISGVSEMAEADSMSKILSVLHKHSLL